MMKIYKTIFPVILYGCETWSLTLTAKARLKVFDMRVLRRISGPKGEEVAGGCTVRSFIPSSPSIIRVMKLRMRWVGHIAHMGEVRNAYKIVVGKSEGKRPCRMHRHRCKDNIRMEVRETGWRKLVCYSLGVTCMNDKTVLITQSLYTTAKLNAINALWKHQVIISADIVSMLSDQFLCPSFIP